MGRDAVGLIPLRGAGAQLERMGGKAGGLARLAAADLPVPDGFVIPPETLDRVLADTGLTELAGRAFTHPGAAAELVERLGAVTLPADLEAAWVAAAERVGPSLAVRSSGLDEDGAEHSFAGQHATVLGVPPREVPAAVRACWQSLWSERAVAYRQATGGGSASLAVLVQQLVRPSCSGVLFTTNPLTGSWREVVVEAVWGLGEGLMSGRIAPHHYLLRRPRGGLPRSVARVAARVRLQVVERQVHELTEQLVPGEHGPVLEATPDHLRHRPTLTDQELRRLARLGLKVEALLGAPADVEWVRDPRGDFLLLQARPVTAGRTPKRDPDQVLWTRRFMGERWQQPATPLGWSLFEPMLTWFVGYPETQARLLGGGPALRLHHGYPYVNATVFRHLLFKLPGSPPPSFMLELIPPEEERAWRRRFAVAPDVSVYTSIFRTTFEERRWRRFRWNPFTNHLAWDRFEARLQRELPELGGRGQTTDERLRLVDRHLDLVREYVGIHICSLLFANLFWQLLDGALASWVPERRQELRTALATCPPGNLTVETNAALRELARLATEEDLVRLAAGDPAQGAFGEALSAFLDRFGHRSESSWELMSPRWRREPARLVPLLRSQLATSHDPAEHAERQEERHRAALAELRSLLTGPRLSTAELLIHHARRYLLLRENQRFWFDRLLWSLQDVLLSFGEDGVAGGWLDAAGDVAFLQWEELRDAVARGRTDELRERARHRKEIWERDAARIPPTFLTGRDPSPVTTPDGERLSGLGISPGRARGTVRVLRSVADGAALRPGDVLVAHAVDPAWTPLFLTAGAVILELGSMLSHGAVVAREYGVPAVVNVEGATRRLRDGQEVTVDGARGAIWLHQGPGRSQ
ncbi:MAG: hypothetical protein H6735_07155 [Alphaproteobacteria bacterium]|nr:hypothetical protein [Alphaproteobacteria bacterium]